MPTSEGYLPVSDFRYSDTLRKDSVIREVYISDAKKAVRCPVYQRDYLKAGTRIVGPALIQEHGTTTVLFKQDDCKVAPSGELIIKVGGA